MQTREEFDLLDLLCAHFGTEDDMGGDEVGVTLLRSVVAHYDHLGFFEAEYFDRNHYKLGNGFVFVPPNAVRHPTYRVSFADLNTALKLEELTYVNLKNAYDALIGMDADVRAAPKRKLPPIAGFYCLIFTLLRKMMDYYALLIQAIVREPESVPIRAHYRWLHSKFQKLPYIQIVKSCLLGQDLKPYYMKIIKS